MRVLTAAATAACLFVLSLMVHAAHAEAPAPPARPRVASTTTTIAEAIPEGVPSDPAKRCPALEPAIAEHGLPVQTFSYIAWRESRCNPLAHNKTRNRNGTQDYGAVQINDSWITVTQRTCGGKRGDMTVLFDLDCNLAVARYLFDNGGLRHWSL